MTAVLTYTNNDQLGHNANRKKNSQKQIKMKAERLNGRVRSTGAKFDTARYTLLSMLWKLTQNISSTLSNCSLTCAAAAEQVLAVV